MAKKFVKVTGLHRLLAASGNSLDASALRSDVTKANNNSICFITCDNEDVTYNVKSGSKIIVSELHAGDTFIWTQGTLHITNNAGASDTKVKDTHYINKAYLLGHTTQNSVDEAVTNANVSMNNGIVNASSFSASVNLYLAPVDGNYAFKSTYDPTAKTVTMQTGQGYNTFNFGTTSENKFYKFNGTTDAKSFTINGSQKTKISDAAGNDYLGLYSNGNEMVIGNGGTDATMYINYRQPGTGYVAPSTYVIMAGNSSSYANVQANHFYSISDKRLKNVLGEISLDKAYDLIDKCSTILYDLKDDEKHKVQIGVIAQEIKEFFPEIINEDEKGTLSVDYSKLTVIVMKVLKDLIARIKKLEEK